jgi:3-oxoacyl-[acyl-carrier-protein] synthase-1
VDSLLRPEVLVRLDGAGRIKSAASRDGFLPGEGAACVVLETAASARERAARVIARLASAARAEEPTAGTDQACRGEGLARAVRDALGGSKQAEGWLVICDLNGERYRSHEWALVNSRLSHASGGFPELWHPADCIGETGAASGALSAVWAATALDRGYAPRRRALLWGASDGPARAAAVVLPATES